MTDLDDLMTQMLGKGQEHADTGVEGKGWRLLTEAGLDRVGLPEELGGSGGDLSDAVTVIVRAAQAGLSVPGPEALVLVSHLAARFHTPVHEGLVTMAVLDGDVAPEGSGLRVRGSANAVPWGAHCEKLWALIPADPESVALVVLDRSESTATPVRELPDPRADVLVDVSVHAARVYRLDDEIVDQVFFLGAFARSCQLLGAMRACLSASTDYVRERHQFGKPLAAHQVVRHQVVSMVNEVAAAEAAVAHATGMLAGIGSSVSERALVAVASAKIQTSQGALQVARAAHQLHGALGLTAEHPLHAFSTRIWAWRDEYGSEHHWSTRLAQLVDDHYKGDLWSVLVDQTARA
jgi:acyl-CoA dehydrogenase